MKKKCQFEVMRGSYPYGYRRCSRKANDNGKFCTQHDPSYIKKKEDEKYKQRKSERDNAERLHKFKNAACQFVKRCADANFTRPLDAFERARKICEKHKIDYKERG